MRDVSAQLESLQSYQGFDVEGRSFDKLEFNYFIYLQIFFIQQKMEPVKFHSLIDDLPSHISVQGKRIKLQNDRTCFWDGRRLYLLSQKFIAHGSSSCFRRMVMIPQSETEELQFYAMLGPIQQEYKDSSELESYLRYLRNDYTVSTHAYNFLYPYVQPRLINYHLNENYMGDIDGKLPALITRSYGGWNTLRLIINNSTRLTEVGFVSVMGWMLSVMIIHEQSCLHRDLSDNNVLVYGPGVFCQLIDMSSVTRLDQCGEVKDIEALSTYPDFTTRFGVYDKQTDVFSLALNLLWYMCYEKKLWSDEDLEELIKKTNYVYKYRADCQVKLKRYQEIYKQIKVSRPIPSYSMLVPHLLNLAHPDRSSRGSLIDVFSDEKIMHTMHDHIYTIGVNSNFSVYFVSIKDWSFERVLEGLYCHVDDSSVASTAILMLLVFALHCEKIPDIIRINHKENIECVLENLSTTPFQDNLMLHYESEFPGQLSNSICFQFIDSMIDEVVREFVSDYNNVRSVVTDLCDRTCDRVVLEHCTNAIDDIANQVVIRDESETLLSEIIDIIECRQNDRDRFICQVVEVVMSQAFNDITSRENTQRTLQLQRSLIMTFLTPLVLSLSIKHYQIDSMDSSALFLTLWVTSLALAIHNLCQYGNSMKIHSDDSYLSSDFFKPAHHRVTHDMSSSKISFAAV